VRLIVPSLPLQLMFVVLVSLWFLSKRYPIGKGGGKYTRSLSPPTPSLNQLRGSFRIELQLVFSFVYIFFTQMRSALVPIASSSTLSRWSVARRMLPTTTHVVTTPLVSSCLYSTHFSLQEIIFIYRISSWIIIVFNLFSFCFRQGDCRSSSWPRSQSCRYVLRSPGLLDLPLLRWRNWIWLHLSPHGEVVGGLRQEVQARVCDLPSTSGVHNIF